MLARLAFGEGGEQGLGSFGILLSVLAFAPFGCSSRVEDDTPAWIQNFLPRSLELHLPSYAFDARCTNEAVGVEGGDEVACDKVKDLLFTIREPRR